MNVPIVSIRTPDSPKYCGPRILLFYFYFPTGAEWQQCSVDSEPHDHQAGAAHLQPHQQADPGISGHRGRLWGGQLQGNQPRCFVI